VPVHFPSDRECLDWVAPTAGKIDVGEITYAWIRNTLELARVAISPNLRKAAIRQADVELQADIDTPWDPSGNLLSPFADSRLGT
jgi:hypothetical protein